MPNNLVPFQGPGGVITYLQPTNTLLGGASNNGNQSINQTSPYQACSRANSTATNGVEYLPVDANNGCPSGWSFVSFPSLNAMQAAIEGLSPGETQSSNVPGPPNVLTGNNSPGQFIAQHNPIADIVDFLNRTWSSITNRNLWKGIGLLAGAAILIIFGAFVWLKGKPNVTILNR